MRTHALFGGKIGRRVWWGFGTLILIVAAGTLTFSLLVSNVDRHLSQLADTQTPLERTVWTMRSSATALVQSMFTYAEEPSPETAQTGDQAETDFDRALAEFLRLSSKEAQRSLATEAAAQFESLKASRVTIAALADSQSTAVRTFESDSDKLVEMLSERILSPIDPTLPQAAEKLDAAWGMAASLITFSQGIASYAAGPGPDSTQTIETARADFHRFDQQYRATALSFYEESWLSEIESEFDNLTDAGDRIRAQADALINEIASFQQEASALAALLGDQLQPLVQAEAESSTRKAKDSATVALATTIGLGIFGILAGGLLAWVMAHRITRPLVELLQGARAVAGGRIEHRFCMDSKDEFGEVSLAFNQMLDQLGRSREALGESEETAWQLLDATTDAVILTDLRGTILACNEAAAQRFGKGLEQMVNMNLYDLLPADVMASRKAQVAEVIRTGRPVHFEDEREGMIYDERLFPVFDERSGRVTRIAVFARDITTRKWVEEVTEQLGKRNELILQAAGEGIYGLDTQGRTTFVNPAAARMLGYRPEDLIGQHHHELVHHSRPNGMPYPHQQCPIHATFKDGAIHQNVDDEVFWRKDGTSFPVEYTSTPIIDDGKIIGAVVTFRDITERKRMEKALRKNEEKYRSIFESAATLIISVDESGRIVDCNARAKRVLGFSPEELIGRHLVDLVAPDDQGKVGECLKEVLTKGFQYNNPFRMVRKDDSLIEVNMNAASVTDENGMYVRTICMITDASAPAQNDRRMD